MSGTTDAFGLSAQGNTEEQALTKQPTLNPQAQLLRDGKEPMKQKPESQRTPEQQVLAAGAAAAAAVAAAGGTIEEQQRPETIWMGLKGLEVSGVCGHGYFGIM